jgi:hypothetical protein
MPDRPFVKPRVPDAGEEVGAQAAPEKNKASADEATWPRPIAWRDAAPPTTVKHRGRATARARNPSICRRRDPCLGTTAARPFGERGPQRRLHRPHHARRARLRLELIQSEDWNRLGLRRSSPTTRTEGRSALGTPTPAAACRPRRCPCAPCARRRPSARRRHPVRIEHRLDVPDACDAGLQRLRVPHLDHEAVLHHRVHDRAVRLEDVDPVLGEGAR